MNIMIESKLLVCMMKFGFSVFMLQYQSNTIVIFDSIFDNIDV